jgi:hypothetical protein
MPATDMNITNEKLLGAVFSVQSVLSLYSEEQQQELRGSLQAGRQVNVTL